MRPPLRPDEVAGEAIDLATRQPREHEHSLARVFAFLDRRPERIETLLDVCACFALFAPGSGNDYAPAGIVRAALAVVKDVDAGAIADQNASQNTSFRANCTSLGLFTV